jgi:hypothetical protein
MGWSEGIPPCILNAHQGVAKRGRVVRPPQAAEFKVSEMNVLNKFKKHGFYTLSKF